MQIALQPFAAQQRLENGQGLVSVPFARQDLRLEVERKRGKHTVFRDQRVKLAQKCRSIAGVDIRVDAENRRCLCVRIAVAD